MSHTKLTEKQQPLLVDDISMYIQESKGVTTTTVYNNRDIYLLPGMRG